MEIRVDNLRIIDKGIIFLEEAKTVKFNFNELKLEVTVLNDENKKNIMEFELEPVPKLIFYNVTEQKTGVFKPEQIATIDDKKIFLAISIERIITIKNGTGYELIYCWYMEE